MAKSYTATLQVNCWKEHSCACCGSTYSYNLVRKVTGRASTPDRAQAGAQAAARKTVETDTDAQPCPTCGLYQPDMIGQRRAKRHAVVFWIALAALALTLGLRLGNVLQADVATWATLALCGAALLVHLLIDLHNPNSNLESNRQLAQQRAAAGVLRHVPGQPAARPDDFARPERSTVHLVALGLLLASVLPVAAPEIMRSTRGWPINEQCYPPVVGPGDTTRVYMPHSITSIKSYWKGTPDVTLRAAPGDAPGSGESLQAFTNQNDWGATIYVKSSEKNSVSHPWVDFTLPDSADLARKGVTCDIDLDLEYPTDTGASSYEVRSDHMHDTVQIRLASPGAGRQYNSFWWGATLAGVGMLLLSGFLLFRQARAAQRLAKPTRVYF